MTNSAWQVLLSSGVVLAACPAIAYLLVFATECGFMFTWFLPVEFVKVNFSMVCLVSIYVLVGIALILCVYIPLSSAFPRIGIGTHSSRYAVVIVPCALLLCAGVCFALGRHRALTKRVFMVSSDRPDIVAVRMYGDYVLCVGVDREKREMNGSIVLHRLEQITNEKWRGDAIGPLIPPKMVPGVGFRGLSNDTKKPTEPSK